MNHKGFDIGQFLRDEELAARETCFVNTLPMVFPLPNLVAQYFTQYYRRSKVEKA